MTKTFSRRDFLKIAGTGSAAAAVLTGCGPASRYVTRRPYADMPEFNQTGQSTYYATTCRECPAGCGIIVRTMEGRAIKSEGNPNHPVSRGKICSAGLTSVQGLYNPDRVRGPVRADGRGSGNYTPATWDEAVEAVRGALQGAPDGIAFLMGMAPDHLFDLVSELTASLGASPPVRYGSLATFESRATLKRAAEALFGVSAVPYFDISTAEYVFAFGDILGQWLSPVAYGRLYGQMRQGNPTQRGYLVVFEPHQTLTGANADEWVPIVPGSEGVLAGALARLVAEQRGVLTAELEAEDITAASQASGVPEERLRSLAGRFAGSEAPLAIPGGGSLAHANGLATAQAILNLNVIANNLGMPGGLFLAAADPFQPAAEPGTAEPAPSAPGGLSEAAALVDRLNSGQVQVLFVHGTNPLFELPRGLGFAEALVRVPLVISFASFPDETSRQADWILPDHTGLESWGYQRELAGADRPTVSGMQPVVVPMYDTRATADVLLAATSGVLPYGDEVAFLQQKVGGLGSQPGFYSATDPNSFWSLWLQNGGWWTADPGLQMPQGTGFAVPAVPAPQPQGEEGSLTLLTFTTNFMDGSGANRPWLQETPNSLTTVMWNSWISIHPETAASLGVTDDDVVKVTSPAGEVEAVVYRYPAIRPDTVAVPFGQGHTALGRFAEGRGFNPANLLPAATNEAGDMSYADVKVTITPTGQKRLLARLESKEGVYGE